MVSGQFKDRLRDHRKQASENKIRAAKELDALSYDRGLFPRQIANHRGELVFDLHPDKPLLRADVEAGKHLSMTSRELQLTNVSYQDHPILGVHGAPVRIRKHYKTVTNTSDWSIGMIFFTELETPNYEKALCIGPLINRLRLLQVNGHQNSIVSLHNKVS
jgi:hypothetical protein